MAFKLEFIYISMNEQNLHMFICLVTVKLNPTSVHIIYGFFHWMLQLLSTNVKCKIHFNILEHKNQSYSNKTMQILYSK